MSRPRCAEMSGALVHDSVLGAMRDLPGDRDRSAISASDVAGAAEVSRQDIYSGSVRADAGRWT